MKTSQFIVSFPYFKMGHTHPNIECVRAGDFLKDGMHPSLPARAETAMVEPTDPTPPTAFAPETTVGDDWMPLHLGRLLGEAMRRFDERVLDLMAHDIDVPLALSNLAARGQISAAHVHLTRHLPPAGARLVDLAQSAGMTKQAMGDLVDQCAAWGLITREPDPRDARARLIRFTTAGRAWQHAFRTSVAAVEREFTAAVGRDVAAVVRIGLEVYAVGS